MLAGVWTAVLAAFIWMEWRTLHGCWDAAGPGRLCPVRAVRPPRGNLCLNCVLRARPGQRHFALKFQDFVLLRHLNVQDNVVDGLVELPVPRDDARAKALAMLERFDMQAFADGGRRITAGLVGRPGALWSMLSAPLRCCCPRPPAGCTWPWIPRSRCLSGRQSGARPGGHQTPHWP